MQAEQICFSSLFTWERTETRKEHEKNEPGNTGEQWTPFWMFSLQPTSAEAKNITSEHIWRFWGRDITIVHGSQSLSKRPNVEKM